MLNINIFHDFLGILEANIFFLLLLFVMLLLSIVVAGNELPVG